jgi:hypothetical protein
VNRRIRGLQDGLGHIASSLWLGREALHVPHDSSRRLALTTFVFVAVLTACGSSTATVTSTPSVTAVTIPTPPTPTTTAASPGCPTAGTVGSALGITLPKPTGIPYKGTTALPAGATGEVCEYHATTLNVIIEVLRNISPSYIAKFSVNFPVAYKSASGVGDQARTFLVSLGGGKDNEGVVATKGSTLVAIGATDTPASLAQIEALVNTLF